MQRPHHHLQAARHPFDPDDLLVDRLLASCTMDFMGDASAYCHPQMLLRETAGEFFNGGCQNEAFADFSYLPQQYCQAQALAPAPPPVPPSGSMAGGGPAMARAQPTKKLRAKRGQATDPHSIAERLRRVKISERMKALRELVPNANKTDKASMLDEIMEYVKFLQVQVKLLRTSRFGGTTDVAPFTAKTFSQGCGGRQTNGDQTANTSDVSLTVMEQRVAKLMEEDIGSALQYLQGEGLCLMPIRLAATISTGSRGGAAVSTDRSGPSSPGTSMLLV